MRYFIYTFLNTENVLSNFLLLDIKIFVLDTHRLTLKCFFFDFLFFLILEYPLFKVSYSYQISSHDVGLHCCNDEVLASVDDDVSTELMSMGEADDETAT